MINTIVATEVGMMRGKRFSRREIDQYRSAIVGRHDDGYIEAMTLFYAEAVFDVAGGDVMMDVMNRAREIQSAFVADVRTGTAPLDELICRVYQKAGLIVPMSENDEEYIEGVLKNAGLLGEKEDGDDS